MKIIRPILILCVYTLVSCGGSGNSPTSSSSSSNASMSGTSSSMPSSLSSSSSGTSTASSATSSSNKIDDSPYSFKNSDVSISTYSYSDTEYKVNGRALVFNGCMKANKSWSALQMCKFDGGIYCKTPLLYNHVVLTIRNAPTVQYVPDDYLNLYYGDEEKPTANFLSSKKVSTSVPKR